METVITVVNGLSAFCGFCLVLTPLLLSAVLCLTADKAARYFEG